MSGTPQPLFVEARRILLDALDALGPQRDAVVLIGAQAVYLRVGDARRHIDDRSVTLLQERNPSTWSPTLAHMALTGTCHSGPRRVFRCPSCAPR